MRPLRVRAAAAQLFTSVSHARGQADVVVEATGDPHALDEAIAWAAPEARIVVASFYGRRRASVDLGDACIGCASEPARTGIALIPPTPSGTRASWRLH
jgi:threonine dehydrogenase-like Zn-dependent dehydrogenase